MIMRVAIPLLLLPLLALLLPMIFGLAWVREALGERAEMLPARRHDSHRQLASIRGASQRAGSLHHRRL
ncbi:MAG TPA: hypothetical protein VGF89_03440 [Steroidobacteraceae bacterium]|jgi:hypothetical protein